MSKLLKMRQGAENQEPYKPYYFQHIISIWFENYRGASSKVGSRRKIGLQRHNINGT